MKLILITYLGILPFFSFAHSSYESDGSSKTYLAGIYDEDEGVKWTCKRCRYSNWKESPPYNCGQCGTAKGQD